MITLRKITLENRRGHFNPEVAEDGYCLLRLSTAAKKLYERFGFRENGEVCHGESVTVVTL
ncbi:hypothetical protein [Saccharibacillus alkalitolerans]|uniref:N-acetyltransferase domain-containing protein n=1 Tax=Saccharibacillus alkalitolerans TaxID=2705290 RepID=A0ABX0F7J6_9BACL|nr:hypothetical protein [Saccharibacillus alkalitolerans]NGZ76928.1 hypothetical protein [Saccharibacillus alkalitolerans]